MEESRTPVLIRIRHSVKARLVQLAKREHRSLNRQIEFLLEHALAKQDSSLSESPKASHEKRKR